MIQQTRFLAYHGTRLSYDQACRISEAVKLQPGGRYVLDLESVLETTTAALARLIRLRIHLRLAGGDLSIAGLHGRAKSLHEISRLHQLLPQCSSKQDPVAT